MDLVLEYGSAILAACWEVLLEAAPWVLFGFLVAGLLKAFVPTDLVHRHLGRSKASNVVKAALFGVPLPLCSCGVVPAAAGLRDQGASKGATASFLISTPETGVDSMAITYALLDPVMTVLRPLAAFLTAVLAGVSINALEKDRAAPAPFPASSADPTEPAEPACSGPSCGCSGPSCAPAKPMGMQDLKPKLPLHRRARGGITYAFDDLLADIGGWFLLGVVIAGLITALVPQSFIEQNLGDGFLPMLIMLVVAVPMYVCATASTPIAAALALKGLSPGAALVFLLAGPATNAASLTVVAKIIGRRAAAIIAASLLLGLAANWLYLRLGLSVTDWVQAGADEHAGIVQIASAVVLLGLLARSSAQKLLSRFNAGGSPCNSSTCSR